MPSLKVFDLVSTNQYFHLVVIKAIYAIIKKYLLEDFWNLPFMYDTCLTVLKVEDKKVEIILEADVSHLNE